MHNNPAIDPLAWLPFSDENLAIFSWNESSKVMCSLAYGVKVSLEALCCIALPSY